jgi:hypothetical protein
LIKTNFYSGYYYEENEQRKEKEKEKNADAAEDVCNFNIVNNNNEKIINDNKNIIDDYNLLSIRKKEITDEVKIKLREKMLKMFNNNDERR